jgi:hypothetical protein
MFRLWSYRHAFQFIVSECSQILLHFRCLLSELKLCPLCGKISVLGNVVCPSVRGFVRETSARISMKYCRAGGLHEKLPVQITVLAVMVRHKKKFYGSQKKKKSTFMFRIFSVLYFSRSFLYKSWLSDWALNRDVKYDACADSNVYGSSNYTGRSKVTVQWLLPRRLVM